MSRKLGAFALVLGVLLCSMELKSLISSTQHHGSVLVANGPDPVPPPKRGGSGK